VPRFAEGFHVSFLKKLCIDPRYSLGLFISRFVLRAHPYDVISIKVDKVQEMKKKITFPPDFVVNITKGTYLVVVKILLLDTRKVMLLKYLKI